MTRHTRAFALLAIFLLAMTAAPPVRAEVIDRLLAVVSGQLIMLSDVRAARELGLVATGSDPDAVGSVLRSLVDRALMLTEVERFVPPEPTAEAIDARMQTVRARFASPGAFEAALARSGIDEAQLRQRIREDLLIQAYLDLRFTVPPPTDEEVAQYFEAHREAFSTAGQTPTLEAVRPRVVEVMNRARRLSLVNDWVDGLRRRADIINLYAPNSPQAP
jgi:hypothetical protein